MKKCISLFLIFCVVLATFAGCASDLSTQEASRMITDALGRQVEIPETVDSIVCVGVGALRYSCYAGAADLVVGVEDYEVKAGLEHPV